MPADGLQQLRPFDAIFLGAVGHPSVPDHVSLWGLLIPIRRSFRQYVNLRPVRLFQGIETPLKNWKPVKLISRSSAKTTKVNIPTSAGVFMSEATRKSQCSRRFSRDAE
jgi:hypothetical protein